MTNGDLQAIKARWSAAAKGPWQHVGDHYVWPDDDSVEIHVGQLVGVSFDESVSIATADAIGAAPTDVAALIEEVERLRALLGEEK